jgi:hypothetical protein
MHNGFMAALSDLSVELSAKKTSENSDGVGIIAQCFKVIDEICSILFSLPLPDYYPLRYPSQSVPKRTDAQFTFSLANLFNPSFNFYFIISTLNSSFSLTVTARYCKLGQYSTIASIPLILISPDARCHLPSAICQMIWK